MRLLIHIFTVFILLSTALTAQETPLRALVNGNDSRGWEAVGRLDFEQEIFCTGALISTDLVITAAHCLFKNHKGQKYAPGEITFKAGWRNGRANAVRGVKLAIAHPEFDYSNPERVLRVSNDLAILQLDQPIRNSSIKPLGIADKPRKWDEVGVISYARDRADSPSLQEVCKVLARQSGTLVLTCDVDFGSSGAPVFTLDTSGNPRIVSVISAKADVKGRKVALGTDLLRPLSDLVELVAQARDAAFTSAPSTPRVRKPGNSSGRTGAKFLRP